MKQIDSTYTLNWDQIELAEKCYPEHEWRAKILIEKFLGYAPARIECIPTLPFIQTLIAFYRKNQIKYDDYCLELEFHMRKIRNDVFKSSWWVTKNPFDDYDYNIYNTELVQHQHRARAELSDLLTYEPELLYSLHSEMMLRRIYQKDIPSTDEEYINVGFFAMAAVLYREILLKEGAQAADASPLLGLRLTKEMNMCPITGDQL